jgi:hypothetical protein
MDALTKSVVAFLKSGDVTGLKSTVHVASNITKHKNHDKPAKLRA